jgi:hypothetical protein
MSDSSDIQLKCPARLQLLYEDCFQRHPPALRKFIEGLVDMAVGCKVVTGSLVAFGFRVRAGSEAVVYNGKSPKSILRMICAGLSVYSEEHGFLHANPYGGTFMFTIVVDGVPHSIDVETENTTASQWFQIRCVG